MERAGILESVTKYFTGHPDGQRIIRQATEAERIKAHEERQRTSKELAEATAADLQRSVVTEQKRAPLLRRLETLQAEQRKVEAQLCEVEMADRRQGLTLSRRMDQARNFLERSPQPELAPFIDRLNEEHRAVAQCFDSIAVRLINNLQQVIWSNDESVKARMGAIEDALRIVRGLAMEPIAGAELDRKLDQLWNSLPEIEPRPSLEEAEAQWNRRSTWGRLSA